MNKKILTTIMMVLLTSASFADSDVMPLPMHGLQIVPLAKMAIPEEAKREVYERVRQGKEKGYYETESRNAQALFEAPRKVIREMKVNKGLATNNDMNDLTDSGLRSNPIELKLAFPFKELSALKGKEVLAYTGIGSWKNGWTGIKIIYNDAVCPCNYMFFNLKLSDGAVQLNQEGLKYDINNKASSTSVEGNTHGGFIYSVQWFTEHSVHRLECASKAFDKEKINTLITLARQIDLEMIPSGG